MSFIRYFSIAATYVMIALPVSADDIDHYKG